MPKCLEIKRTVIDWSLNQRGKKESIGKISLTFN